MSDTAREEPDGCHRMCAWLGWATRVSRDCTGSYPGCSPGCSEHRGVHVGRHMGCSYGVFSGVFSGMFSGTVVSRREGEKARSQKEKTRSRIVHRIVSTHHSILQKCNYGNKFRKKVKHWCLSVLIKPRARRRLQRHTNAAPIGLRADGLRRPRRSDVVST